jgi:hypothetical protein
MYAIIPTDQVSDSHYGIAVDSHPTENAILINLNFVDEVDLKIELFDGRSKNLICDSGRKNTGSYRLELPSFDINSYILSFTDIQGRFSQTYRIMKAFC